MIEAKEILNVKDMKPFPSMTPQEHFDSIRGYTDKQYEEWLNETNVNYDEHYKRYTATSKVVGKVFNETETEIDRLKLENENLKAELALRVDYASECRSLCHEVAGLKTDVQLLNNIIAKRDAKIKELEEIKSEYENECKQRGL